jgi:hypothetical protein
MSRQSLCVFATLIVASLFASSPTRASVVLTEIGEAAGVRVVHDPLGYRAYDGSSVQDFYGPGVAVEDINHDGWLDIVVANGETGNYLFLNDGDGTFTEIGAEMRVRESRVTNGIAVADLDNDGLNDMVFGNFYREPQLFMHYADVFTDTGELMGFVPLLPGADESGPYPESMGISYGDINQDGWLDIYVANYRDQPDVLYMSLPGGGYYQYSDRVEVTREGYGFQALFWDFDNDRDLDVYVANDFGVNFLFENMGPPDYQFVENAVLHEVLGPPVGTTPTQAINHPKGMSMGLAAADYDNDLDLDLFITNFQLNILYRNDGQGAKRWLFTDVAKAKGVEYEINCWGADFVDLDLDTDLDLVQASGYIFSANFLQPYENPNKCWINNGAPSWNFSDVSDEVGFNDTMMARGLATGDLDRDGDLDIVVVNNSYYRPTPDNVIEYYEGHLLLYRNDQQTGRNWVTLKLEGSKARTDGPEGVANRSAVGARVYLTAGGLTQMREIQAGASFMSHNSLEVEFGLGDAASIDEVRVLWPGGAEEYFGGVQINRYQKLIEGRGWASSVPVALVSFDAQSTADGVRLDWVTAPGLGASSVEVLRADAEAPELLRRVDVELFLEQSGGSALDRDVRPGQSYVYQLILLGADGYSTFSGLAHATAREGSTPAARRPAIGQNFPNPFNPRTTIQFTVPRQMDARVVLYDARGRLVRTLFDGPAPAGTSTVDWDGLDDAGRAVSSGVYTYALITEEGTSSRRLTLTR